MDRCLYATLIEKRDKLREAVPAARPHSARKERLLTELRAINTKLLRLETRKPS